MLALLIIALAIFLIVGIGLYFWQRSAPGETVQVLPPPPDFRGLFEEGPAGKDEVRRLAAVAREDEASSLIARAKNGERPALVAAKSVGDARLYDRVLSELVTVSDSDPKLLSLMSYITKNELPANNTLAAAVIASWQDSPDRHGTSKALHFAALSDNAELYQEAVELSLQLWREGKLADVSAVELRALFDGEFWILSSRTRSSGAGFVLKRTLDSARRELEAAAGAHQ